MSDGDPSGADAPLVVAVVDPRPLVRDRLHSVIDGLDGVHVQAVYAAWSDVPAPVDEDVLWVGPTHNRLVSARQVSLEDVGVDDPGGVLAQLHSPGVATAPDPADADDVDLTHRPLSPREAVVLEGIARGRSATEIAEDLGISTKAVENARRRAMEKLDVTTQVEAVSRAHALRAAGVDLTGGRLR